MSESSEHLSVGEFTRWTEAFERQVQTGFDRTSREIANVSRGLHKRLDQTDGDLQNHGERLATLEERTRGNRRSAQGWGAGIGAGVAGLISLLSHIKEWLGK